MATYTLYSTEDGPGVVTDGVAVSGAATHYSKPVSCTGGDGFGIHIRWTGTPTGTFTVWKSDMKEPNPATDTDWFQDPDFGTSGSVAAAGSASSYANSSMNAKNRWWRVRYVHASGSGTVFANATKPRQA